jgi:hypothetical protein
MLKTPLIAGALALAATSTAHAGWTGWKWRTDHFTGQYTANPAFENFIRVPAHPKAGVPPTLLLFLPGTGGDDVDAYTDFLDEAANRGYYVIGLAYRNTQHGPDMTGCWPAAYSDYFDQQVHGTNHKFWLDDQSNGIYPEFNSVSYRLRELLDTMTVEHPANINFNWNQFWDAANEKPMWSRIVVAGHSQGGDTAMWITKNESPLAALIFEGGYDRLDRGPPDVGLGISPWNETIQDCNGHRGDFAPFWVTPGSWVQKVILIDSEFSGVYDGSSLGHWIDHTAQDFGKTKANEAHLVSAPAVLTASWNTLAVATSCGGHQAPIVNGCYPSWMPQLWDLALDKAFAVTSPLLAQ